MHGEMCSRCQIAVSLDNKPWCGDCYHQEHRENLLKKARQEMRSSKNY